MPLCFFYTRLIDLVLIGAVVTVVILAVGTGFFDHGLGSGLRVGFCLGLQLGLCLGLSRGPGLSLGPGPGLNLLLQLQPGLGLNVGPGLLLVL